MGMALFYYHLSPLFYLGAFRVEGMWKPSPVLMNNKVRSFTVQVGNLDTDWGCILASLMELYAENQPCYFNSLQDEKNGGFFCLTMVQEDTLILWSKWKYTQTCDSLQWRWGSGMDMGLLSFFSFSFILNEYVFIFQMHDIKKFWGQPNQLEQGSQLLTLIYRNNFARVSVSILLLCTLCKESKG